LEVSVPRATRISFPKGYGSAKEVLAWAGVRARLEEARAYWLATTRAGGAPHVVPVDGLWIDDVWYYGGARDTVHRRTVAQNPHAVMHLADPFQAVIVEGVVRGERPSPELGQRLADASNTKYADYGYQNDAASYADVLALFPTRVLAWTAFPRDATRFEFD
jgi:hypothetical protein